MMIYFTINLVGTYDSIFLVNIGTENCKDNAKNKNNRAAHNLF
jgi:hypothetical protein